MDQQFNLSVVELLFSRMCHDLVGPVGAAVNGVELLEEFGNEMAEEALGLLGSSARVASKRLRVYRVAYGMATGAAITSLSDLKSLVDDYLEGGKIDLLWPDENIGRATQLQRLGIKLILNLVICATEAMPRGGKLDLSVEPVDSKIQVNVKTTGEGVRLAEGVSEAFHTDINVASLDPRTVQSYFTGKIAESLDANFKCVEEADGIVFSAIIPSGA